MLGEEGERRGVGVERKVGRESLTRAGGFIAGSGTRKQHESFRLRKPRRHI